MAPYSEWTGCGSGITKNCEWLNAEKRETADPYRQKQCKHRKKKKKKVYSNKKQ